MEGVSQSAFAYYRRVPRSLRLLQGAGAWIDHSRFSYTRPHQITIIDADRPSSPYL